MMKYLPTIEFSELNHVFGSNYIKKGIALAFSFFFLWSAWAEKVEVDGIYYNLNSNGSAEVTYRGDEEDGWMYFSADELYVGDLDIPSQVEYNGKMYEVTALGDNAFAGSTYLQSLVLPATVTTTGWGIFTLCNSLEYIQVDDLNPVFLSMDGVMYQRSPLSIFFVPKNISGDVALLDEITEIPSSAFQKRLNITSITLPAEVRTIADGAFNDCTNLTEIFFNDKLESIGERSFSNCINLSVLDFPESVKTIKPAAFTGCSGLVYVLFHEGLTSIGKMAFYGCSSIVGVQLPTTLSTIEEQAFKDCVSLDVVENNSKLPVEIGSTDYGYVAYYASQITKGSESAAFNVIADNDMSIYKADGRWFVANASGMWISVYSISGQFLGRHFCQSDVEEIPFASPRIVVVPENR